MYLITTVSYPGYGDLRLRRVLTDIEVGHLQDGGSVGYRLLGETMMTVEGHDVDWTKDAVRIEGRTADGFDDVSVGLFREHLAKYFQEKWEVIDGTNAFRDFWYTQEIVNHKLAFKDKYRDELRAAVGKIRIELGLSVALQCVPIIEKHILKYNLDPEDLHLGLSQGAYKGALMVVNRSTRRMVEIGTHESSGRVKLTYGTLKRPWLFKRLWRLGLHTVIVKDDTLTLVENVMAYIDGTLPAPE